ncbi:TetR/AcrR family transcriptional regulator [Streptomyces sp. BE20]|uniref:TetR/AcrR family transcriptional regulator n=1 Tax=Streptomyces sp. BE20 TaxID=3002525 RepID=UPI002E75C84F|nr:TetR/AcrR family transcriptional regulator [Streptomyces sp. BE20]MEE1824497.1 TetR/AcrR family transcriptional regulator [Streptomyces sp. BE20]
MGRPRAFDEDRAVETAAELFALRGYEGTSVDDLVTGLGVHRGSLYKVFGSKRGLYLAALRRHLDQEVLPLAAALGTADGLAELLVQAAAGFDGGPAGGLLLSAAVERAGSDPEVGALVAEGLAALDTALARAAGPAAGESAGPGGAEMLAATVLGLRLRARAGVGGPSAASLLAFAGRFGGTGAAGGAEPTG